MRSSLVKHLWLIQPNEHHSAVLPIDAAGGATDHFSPAWDLVCLRAFIRERTGHSCDFIDVRLSNSLEEAFADAESYRYPDVSIIAVIYVATAHLGSAGAIVRYIKKHHPKVTIVLFGPVVNSFPEILSLLPGVDFGLRGDPETKLRHLLDSLDIPHRLGLVPGVLKAGGEPKPAQWSDDMRAFSLPPWNSIDWHAYRHDPAIRGAHIEARLSRGNPGTPADAAWPEAAAPLRAWPMERMANAMQKCPGNGINEIFFSDPPGFWSDTRLEEWTQRLKALRNTQGWAFQIMARELPPAVIADLFVCGCRRIEIIIPTLDPRRQAELGMTANDQQIKDLVARLRAAAVNPAIIFWIEGPRPIEHEAETILNKVKFYGRPPYAVYPFPFHLDAPLYEKISATGGNPPRFEEWITWAQREDTADAPAGLWSGVAGVARAEATMKDLQRRIARDPWRAMRRWLSSGETGLRARLENRAAGAWQRMTAKPAGKP